jgi:hypothetical protein
MMLDSQTQRLLHEETNSRKMAYSRNHARVGVDPRHAAR